MKKKIEFYQKVGQRVVGGKLNSIATILYIESPAKKGQTKEKLCEKPFMYINIASFFIFYLLAVLRVLQKSAKASYLCES